MIEVYEGFTVMVSLGHGKFTSSVRCNVSVQVKGIMGHVDVWRRRKSQGPERKDLTQVSRNLLIGGNLSIEPRIGVLYIILLILN